jgi:RimJ/RimL family protein N-acetyltransferase
MSVVIRDAKDSDVDQLRDLFALIYGDDYPFPGFYDTEWLKKSVYDDSTLFLVAEVDGDIVATGSIMLDVGGLNDLIGELGRLVASPAKKARGAAKELIAELLSRIKNKVQFAFGEVRTVHRGSQRLAEGFGWQAVGFEPLKYQFKNRESVVFYANLDEQARELRKNNPRLIPEIFPLAQDVLTRLDLPVDAVCLDEPDGYPTHKKFEIERLNEQGVTSLLRIERGRISNREVFGNFSLSHGFFRISNSNSYYLVAKDENSVLGAIGFTHDPIDSKVRIFEMIEFDDAVKGYLLSEVNRIATEEFDAAYQEVDISAYSPKMQRTLERLGFVPVAYCPSMVFDNVERLDVIRMAKLNIQYDLGPMRLLKGGQRMQALLEERLHDRLVGMEITEGTKKADLFKNLPEGELLHLSSIAILREHKEGTHLIHKGDIARHLYVIAEGEAQVISEDKVLATLGEGTIFGEMALLDSTKRSADVKLSANSKIIEIEINSFERLLATYPRLGYTVMQNLASGLSRKLREQSAK